MSYNLNKIIFHIFRTKPNRDLMGPFENVINVQKTFQTSSWVLNKEERPEERLTWLQKYAVLSSFSVLWDIEPTISSYRTTKPTLPHCPSPPSSTLSTLPSPAPNMLTCDKPSVWTQWTGSHLMYSEEPSRQGDIEHNSNLCEHQWAAAVRVNACLVSVCQRQVPLVTQTLLFILN